MSERRFMELVRAYVRESKRRNRSYSEAVLTLRKMRASEIEASEPDESKRLTLLSKMDAFLTREYGAADSTFEVPASG